MALEETLTIVPLVSEDVVLTTLTCAVDERVLVALEAVFERSELGKPLQMLSLHISSWRILQDSDCPLLALTSTRTFPTPEARLEHSPIDPSSPIHGSPL